MVTTSHVRPIVNDRNVKRPYPNLEVSVLARLVSRAGFLPVLNYFISTNQFTELTPSPPPPLRRQAQLSFDTYLAVCLSVCLSV